DCDVRTYSVSVPFGHRAAGHDCDSSVSLRQHSPEYERRPKTSTNFSASCIEVQGEESIRPSAIGARKSVQGDGIRGNFRRETVCSYRQQATTSDRSSEAPIHLLVPSSPLFSHRPDKADSSGSGSAQVRPLNRSWQSRRISRRTDWCGPWT